MKKVSVLFATNSPLTKGMSAGRGVAKKMIIAIMLVFCAMTVRAENTNISTSQYYVDTNAATRQDAAPANNANTVMTYDSTVDSGIGTKAIYNESSTYETQKNALVTAATANAAIQNGINSEFVCANPPKCNLWNMAGLFPTTLPAGYTQLEYIESDGRQYINTGVLPTNDIGVSVKYAFTELISQTYIFGSYSPHYYLGINTARSSMTASYGFTAGNGVLSMPIADVVVGQPYEFNINYYNSAKVEWVGIKSATLEPKNFHSNSRTMDMFAAETLSSQQYKSSSRIYYMRITDGDSLVRNFIPARQDSTGTLGMYDTVTNTFYTNDGTGTFIAGPVASFMPQNQ